MARVHVEARINGEPVEFLCEANATLLTALRDAVGLTGTKEGCATGDCGACSIIMNGRLVPSSVPVGWFPSVGCRLSRRFFRRIRSCFQRTVDLAPRPISATLAAGGPWDASAQRPGFDLSGGRNNWRVVIGRNTVRVTAAELARLLHLNPLFFLMPGDDYRWPQ